MLEGLKRSKGRSASGPLATKGPAYYTGILQELCAHVGVGFPSIPTPSKSERRQHKLVVERKLFAAYQGAIADEGGRACVPDRLHLDCQPCTTVGCGKLVMLRLASQWRMAFGQERVDTFCLHHRMPGTSSAAMSASKP